MNMKCRANRKRLLASLLISAAVLQSAVQMPAAAADEASYIFRDSFESGDGGWSGRGGCTVRTSTDSAYEGSGALSVTGRTDTWQGPEKALSGICEAGSSYSFSVCVGYESGPETMKFQLSLSYKDANDKVNYEHLAAAEALCGSYVQLANPEFTIPAGAAEPILYVETLSGSGAFFIDEAICAESGTAIDGPKPVEFLLGDVNLDGVINAADLTLAKRYPDKEFPNRTMRRAADVNQNGSVTEDDINWFVQYLTGQTAAYPEKVAPPVTPFDYNPSLQYHGFDEKEYLEKDAAHRGTVVEEHYDGTTGMNTLYVYVPYGYDESQKYNIFYLLHGGGENEKTLFFQDDTMMQKIFDHMIENGEMDPMIIVTPTWNQTGADKFYTEFREKVVPFVEGKYSTYAESTSIEDLQASRYHRAYGGFSMGSVSTWGVLCHNLDIVAYYMPLSGDYRINNWSAQQKADVITKAIQDSGLKTNEYFIFCATGSEDIAYPNMTPQIEEMKKRPEYVYSSDLSQGNFYYLVRQGGIHWWANVRHYIYDILPYFFHEGQ